MDRHPQRAPVSASPFNGAWPLRRSLLAAQDLAHQVAGWHARGRLHGQVRLENIEVLKEHRVILAPPQGARRFGGIDCNLELCPPELAGETDIRLGEDLQSAAAALRRNGITFDPRRIDVYQMSAVLCQWLTGTTVQTYADSLRLKLQVPAAARDLLDRGLGFDSSDRLQTCEEFSQAIAAALVEDLRSGPATVRDTDRARSAALSDTDTSHVASTPLPSISQSEKISHLAHFQLLELIGRGGMGEVYRARDTKLDRVVAVKVLRQDLAADESFIQRFQAEAQSLARLPHPNLLPLYYTGIDQGRRFFVMRYVEGESLADRLRHSPRPDLQQTLEIIAQCLAALSVAHDEGLIHRDVKPANVLLERNTNQAYLVDFGLARRMDDDTGMTRTGVVMGTVEYLSPEQARGVKQIDHRADLYSLGVMLYQMLAGQLPFAADSAVGWIFQHAHETPVPLEKLMPELAPDLCSLVVDLLAKRPDDRPADCRAVLDRLAPLLRCEPRVRQFSREASSLLDDDEVVDDAKAIDDISLVKPGAWVKLQDQAATLLHHHTPEWLRLLQSTEQQIDGVIARCERRLRRLQALQADGREVHELLQSQIAALAADAENTDTPRHASILEELSHLQSQEASLGERTADIDVAVAKVNATLLGLISQRDALRRRLQHLKPYSTSAAPRRRTLPIAMAIAGTVVLATGIAWQQGLFKQTPSPVVDQGTSGAGSRIPPPDDDPKTVPSPPERFEDSVDFKAAKLVLKLGGKLKVESNGYVSDVSSMDELPIVPYRIDAIDLTNVKNLKREHSELFAQLKSLRVINYMSTGVNDDVLVPLANMDNLSELRFGNTKVTGKELARFPVMPTITAVAFGGPFQSEHLTEFHKFPNARGLYLGWTLIDDKGLAHFPPLPEVRQLNIDHNKIAGPGLVHLEQLPNLEVLRLGQTQLTDDGLSYLPPLPKLKVLNLDDTTIGDPSIPHLSKYTSLGQLTLKQTHFSAEGIALLRKKLPLCVIESTSAVPPKDDKVLSELTAEIAKNPQKDGAQAGLLFKRGREYFARRQFVAAEQDFLAGLQIAPQDHSPRAHLAAIYLAMDDQSAYRKEQAVLLKALEDVELHWSYRLQLLRTVTLKPLSAAEMEITKLQPGDLTAQKHVAESVQIALNYRDGKYPEAIAQADQHLQEHQAQLGTLYVKLWRAMALWQIGQQDAAKAALEEARKFATACRGFALAAPWDHVTEAIYAQAIHREASQLILQTVEPLAIPVLVTDDQRLAELNQKLKANLKDSTALLERAKLHRRWHRWDESADDYDAYLALDVNNSWARIDAAMVALAANRTERYFELCEESESLLLDDSPTGPKIFPLQAARNLSLRPGAVKNPSAVLAKAKAFAETDKNVWVFCVQVPLLYRMGRDDEVLKVGQQVLDMKPGHGFSAPAHLYRALALHRLGRVDEAKAELSAAQHSIKSFPPAGAEHYQWDEYVEALLVLPEVESVVK